MTVLTVGTTGLPSLRIIRDSTLPGGSESSFTSLPALVESGGIFTSTISRPLFLIVNKCVRGCVGSSVSIFSRIILVLLTVTSIPSFLKIISL